MEKNIKLKLVDTASNGSKHVQLLIDDSDCGILYLSPSEYKLVCAALARSTSDLEYTFDCKDTDQDDDI